MMIKQILCAFVILVSQLSWSGDLAMGNADILSSPLPSAGGNGVISFDFVEMSGSPVTVGSEQQVNVTITVNMKKITLADTGVNSIRGELLNYFTVRFEGSSNQLIFEQKAEIAGFESAKVEIPVKVTENSRPTDSDLNGFSIGVNATDRLTVVGDKIVETYTYTN